MSWLLNKFLTSCAISKFPPTHRACNPFLWYTEYSRTVYVYIHTRARTHTHIYIEGRALIFLLKIQRIRAQVLYVRGGIHEWQPVYGSARYSLETFRGRWVFFSCSRPSRRTKGGWKEGEKQREKVWATGGIRERRTGGSGGFRNPSGTGVVFSVRFQRRNGRARRARAREECLIPARCTGLLYEILIPGDIQQAYIRLACKSPPYLISRGCDAPGDDGSFYAAATFPSLLLPSPFSCR